MCSSPTKSAVERSIWSLLRGSKIFILHKRWHSAIEFLVIRAVLAGWRKVLSLATYRRPSHASHLNYTIFSGGGMPCRIS